MSEPTTTFHDIDQPRDIPLSELSRDHFAHCLELWTSDGLVLSSAPGMKKQEFHLAPGPQDPPAFTYFVRDEHAEQFARMLVKRFDEHQPTSPEQAAGLVMDVVRLLPLILLERCNTLLDRGDVKLEGGPEVIAYFKAHLAGAIDHYVEASLNEDDAREAQSANAASEPEP